MHSNRKKVSKFVQWWVTPKLPVHDVFVPYISKEKNPFKKIKIFTSQWILHPLKRRLARAYLRILKKNTDIKVIAITGSVGKTTTKDMLASILSRIGKTLSTHKSVDSVYNIPNTILKTPPWTKYLVLEMSVEYPSEMDYYLWLAKPDIGAVTNVFPTHTLYLASSYGVAQEKAKLTKSLRSKDIAVLSNQNKYTQKMGNNTKAKVIWFGEKGLIRAKNIKRDKNLNIKYTLIIKTNKINVHLPVVSKKFVDNSLAAVGVAYALKIPFSDIKKGLESYKKPEHRMNLIKHASGALIIDDSYNNNPQAARDALETLNEIAGGKRMVVVMGDMLELGKLEEKSHREIGQLIGEMGVDYLIGIGDASKLLVSQAERKLGEDKCAWVASYADVLRVLKPHLRGNTVVLIKGSRSIGLDKVIPRLFRYPKSDKIDNAN